MLFANLIVKRHQNNQNLRFRKIFYIILILIFAYVFQKMSPLLNGCKPCFSATWIQLDIWLDSIERNETTRNVFSKSNFFDISYQIFLINPSGSYYSKRNLTEKRNKPWILSLFCHLQFFISSLFVLLLSSLNSNWRFWLVTRQCQHLIGWQSASFSCHFLRVLF